MILLNKKRILFIITIIICSILSFSTQNHQDCNLVVTSSTPVSNHTVILDAGHGNPDGGATNNNGDIVESNLNLDIVLKLQNLLESANCNVILTRSDQNGIYEADATTIRDKKISDMKNRANIANESKADIFVSIHMNKLAESKYTGWQTFYKNQDDASRKIASQVQKSLNNFMEKENSREIKSISGIYLTKHINIPLIIVECGFLSNPQEAILLNSDNYQNELAWSIYIGIMDYFKEN